MDLISGLRKGYICIRPPMSCRPIIARAERGHMYYGHYEQLTGRMRICFALLVHTLNDIVLYFPRNISEKNASICYSHTDFSGLLGKYLSLQRDHVRSKPLSRSGSGIALSCIPQQKPSSKPKCRVLSRGSRPTNVRRRFLSVTGSPGEILSHYYSRNAPSLAT